MRSPYAKYDNYKPIYDPFSNGLRQFQSRLVRKISQAYYYCNFEAFEFLRVGSQCEECKRDQKKDIFIHCRML